MGDLTMTFGYLQGVNQNPNKFLRFLVSKKSSSKISKGVEQVLFKMRLHQQSTMGDLGKLYAPI